MGRTHLFSNELDRKLVQFGMILAEFAALVGAIEVVGVAALDRTSPEICRAVSANWHNRTHQDQNAIIALYSARRSSICSRFMPAIRSTPKPSTLKLATTVP